MLLLRKEHFDCPNHRVHMLVEMKQGQCICPLSWSVHCNFTGDGKCNEKGVCVHPPPSPARTDFTLITECTPESSGCNSVYSVVLTETRADNTFNKGGRGESCTLVLCSFTTVMSCMDLSVRIVTKSPKGGRLLIFSISLERLLVPKLPN